MSVTDGLPKYPWLKGHGSIEAGLLHSTIVQKTVVSMAERAWLH